MVTRISMDPSKIDENLGQFQSQILPQIKAAPGYLALRSMINPDTGEGIVGSLWADDQSMQGAADAAMSRRPDATARGVNFGETSYRDLVFMDMP
jgi:hypothetical protein